jgi:hypothetical protein
MIFTCGLCKYSFERKAKPDRCPDCGKTGVREATEGECTDYARYREEFSSEDDDFAFSTIPGAVPVRPMAIPIVKEFKNGEPIFEDEPYIFWEPILRRVVVQ